MADDPRPEPRAYVTIAETEWELVPTGKLSWPEAKEIKRVTASPGVPGMALVDLERGLASSDPDAWLAWIYISIRRTRATVTIAEIEALIGDTPVVAVIETVRRDAPEVAAPDPPARTSENASVEQKNGSGSGEKIQPPSTPVTVGNQT
jgi:hypothetical protein